MQTRPLVFALLVGASLWGALQDPKPAPPPQDPARLPPAPEPFVSPVLRGDLPGRFTPRDPIEGVWRLSDRIVEGVSVGGGDGYMIIGRKHLMVQFFAPGPDPEIPMLLSRTYTWSRTDDRGGVRLTTLFGYGNDEDGDILIEPTGKVEDRAFENTASVLRLRQGVIDWLDFVRVE